MKSYRKLIVSLLLFPIFMGLYVPEEPAAAAVPDPAPAATDTHDDEPSGKPDDMTQQEWDNLTPGEQSAYRISDDDIIAEDGGEIPENELDEVIADDETPPAGDDETQKQDDEVPAGDDEQPAPAVEVSDESLLALRVTVSDSELPLSDDVPPELQAEYDALEEKFENGDIDAKTHRAETSKLDRQVMAHNIQQRDVARESRIWEKEQAAFIAARPEYKEVGADGKTFTVRSEALFGALSQQVSRLNADPANASKTGMQILIQADRMVKEALGITKPAPKQAVATTPAKPTPPKAPLPKTPNLAQIPAAGDHDADPFAHIDRIKDPMMKEQAIAEMTPRQQEAYLNGVR